MLRLLNPRFYIENPRLGKLILIVFLIGFAYMFTISRQERKLCQDTCEAKAFVSFRYSPQDRNNPPRCFCLTMEESTIRDRVPKGTEVDFLSSEE